LNFLRLEGDFANCDRAFAGFRGDLVDLFRGHEDCLGISLNFLRPKANLPRGQSKVSLSLR